MTGSLDCTSSCPMVMTFLSLLWDCRQAPLAVRWWCEGPARHLPDSVGTGPSVSGFILMLAFGSVYRHECAPSHTCTHVNASVHRHTHICGHACTFTLAHVYVDMNTQTCVNEAFTMPVVSLWLLKSRKQAELYELLFDQVWKRRSGFSPSLVCGRSTL